MSRLDAQWMPLHIGPYLADTMHLRTAEHGAFLLLLMHYWRKGPLADDDRKLAGIARMTAREWAEHGSAIREFFHLGADGLLHQKRADLELAKAAEISGKRAAAAHASHAQRGRQAACKPDANAAQMETHAPVAAPEPLPEPSQQAAPPTAVAGATPEGIRERVWREGLALLERATGLPRAKARVRLGQFLKDSGDDLHGVMQILLECPHTGDPQSWLTAAIRARARPRPSGFFPAKDSHLAKYAAELQRGGADAFAGPTLELTPEDVS